jgi:hypothetical protein
MIQRLSAAEQHLSRIVRKSFNKHAPALGHFSVVEPIAAQSIIRDKDIHYCWRRLRASDIHTMKFNQCEACQRYNPAGPEYITAHASQANQSKFHQLYLRQIIDLESVSYTINIIRIHKFIVVIVVDKLSAAYSNMMLTSIKNEIKAKDIAHDQCLSQHLLFLRRTTT